MSRATLRKRPAGAWDEPTDRQRLGPGGGELRLHRDAPRICGEARHHVSDAVRHSIAFAVAFTIITFLHIVLGELAPKNLALDRAERVALSIAWPLRLFHTLFGWPIRMLDFAGRSTVRLMGIHSSQDHASVYTVDELRHIINISHTSGTLEAGEQQLLHRIFELSDSEVKDVMIPRNAVTALPITATLEEALSAFNLPGFSRIPVYQDQLDNIVGIVGHIALAIFLVDILGHGAPFVSGTA